MNITTRKIKKEHKLGRIITPNFCSKNIRLFRKIYFFQYIIMNKSRAYCFTINNYTPDDIASVKKLKYKYYIIGYEIAPTTGTPHIQGYVYFKNPISFKSLSKKLQRASIQIAKGSPLQNFKYCSKGGDYEQDGEMPRQGTRSDLEGVRTFVKENTIKPMSNLLEDTNVNYQGIRLAEKYLTYCEKTRDFEPEVIWYYGATGTGKTRRAFEDHPGAYFKTGNNQWWDGYDAHEVCIIDEFRKDFCKFHELLRLLDRYPYRVAYKGGFRQMLSKKIVITSCYRPEEIYATREDVQQLLRRINEIIEVS